MVLGLTFKENVRDLRNSKVVDLITGMIGHDLSVEVYDPNADTVQAHAMYNIDLLDDLSAAGRYDAVIPAVPHQEFIDLDISHLLADGGLVADIKGIWQQRSWPERTNYWLL